MVKTSKEPLKKKLKTLKMTDFQFYLKRITKSKELQKRTNKIMKNSKKSKILTERFLMNLMSLKTQSQSLMQNLKRVNKK